MKAYSKFAYAAIAKCITSAGQTSFCMGAATQFMFRNSNVVAQNYLISMAMVAGFMVNATLKLPVIYLHYVNHDHQSHQKPVELHRGSSKFLYYFLMTFGFISAEISDPLNAYLGSVIILEKGFGLAAVDIHDENWKEWLTQFSGVVFAVGIAMANYAYDFRYIKQNTQVLVEVVDKRIFRNNKALYMTLLFSIPVLIGAPVLNFFFTQPAIKKIPGAKLILDDPLIELIAGVFAMAAFIKCIAALPSIYDTFHNPASDKPSVQSCKARLFQCNAVVSGLGDSIASGLCLLASIISIAKILFKLSVEQTYDGTLVAVAILFACSQAIQNALFGIYPGYKETIKLIDKPQDEETLLIQAQ